MYISSEKRAVAGYLGMAAFCGIFSFVYELLSHHVYSAYMICLAGFPLILGAVPIIIMEKALRPRSGETLRQHSGETLRQRSGETLRPRSGETLRTLQLWTVITLTVGSCLSGVFEIYGTVSAFTRYYWIIGGIMLIMTAAGYVLHLTGRMPGGLREKTCQIPPGQ